MDVLSQVLKSVRLEGALFLNAEFTAPWWLESSATEEIGPLLLEGMSPEIKHVIVYHLVTSGEAYARLPQGDRVELSAGDIVVFPHGSGHVIGNGQPDRAVDCREALMGQLSQGLELVQYGGGGEATRLVCGFLACDRRVSDVFLAGLPNILKINVANSPTGRWLKNSIRYSAGELHRSSEGSLIVSTKLSELLFIETLRLYVNGLPSDCRGWLAGARDAVIGQALALLHKDPAHPWTILSLARRVATSRTALAERFRHYLGETPMTYLAKWRLRLGAQMLQTTEDSVAMVAAAVGYGSEAAFNRAFKREFDCPPAQFRKARRAVAA